MGWATSKRHLAPMGTFQHLNSLYLHVSQNYTFISATMQMQHVLLTHGLPLFLFSTVIADDVGRLALVLSGQQTVAYYLLSQDIAEIR